MQDFKDFSSKLLRYNTESVSGKTFWMNGVGANKPGTPLLWFVRSVPYFAVDSTRFTDSIMESTELTEEQKQKWVDTSPHFKNSGVVFLPKAATKNIIPIYESQCQRARGGLLWTIDNFLGLVWLTETKEKCESWSQSCKTMSKDVILTESKPKKEQIQELVEVTKLAICLRD